MRFMMFVYPGVPETGEWEPPSAEMAAEMNRYNEELTKAGVLLALDGLHPASEGARVRFGGGRPAITDGPFSEAKEVVGGYWIIQAKSKQEAVEWASRAPMLDGDMIEVRRVYELSDFPEDVQEAAALSELPPQQTSA